MLGMREKRTSAFERSITGGKLGSRGPGPIVLPGGI